MIRAAIINTKTNMIENVVEYETLPEGKVPGFDDDHIAVADDRVSMNWTWDGQKLVEPEAPTIKV